MRNSLVTSRTRASRHVAPAALLIAQRKQRRQRRASGQRGVCSDDLLRLGAVDEVVVQLAAGRAKGVVLIVELAELEIGAVGVVEEDAVRLAARTPT